MELRIDESARQYPLMYNDPLKAHTYTYLSKPVCLSMCDLLVDTRHLRVKIARD